MNSRTQRWELAYVFLDASVRGLIWVIPLLISAFSYGLYTSTPAIDLSILVALGVSVFLITGFAQLYIGRKVKNLRLAHETIIEILKEDRNKQLEEIKSRGARAYPDSGYVVLEEYNRLIEAISSKGYIEFSCEMLIEHIPHNSSLYLFKAFPGMHKIYIVLATTPDAQNSMLCRLYKPGKIDGRDFSITWFDHIFRILGSACVSISDLQVSFAPKGETTGEYFEIKRHKIYKKKEAHIFRLYIE